MAILGQDLKKEREMRGISLKEIADTTKINLRFLRALEESRLDLMPGEFFTKGILRAYAGYLGIEQHDVLNRYYEEEQIRQKAAEEEPGASKENPAHKSKLLSFLGFMALVAILAGILTAFYFLFRTEKPVLVNEQVNPTSLPQNDAQILKTIKPQIPDSVKDLNFVFTFQKTTWIQIKADEKIVLDGTQQPGLTFETKARNNLLIQCGNLGGFTYTINGKKGKKLGGAGAVGRNILITPENMDQFIEEGNHPFSF